MKVSDLIHMLEKMPQDMDAVVSTEFGPADFAPVIAVCVVDAVQTDRGFEYACERTPQMKIVRIV